jgi:hypothetical protein
MRQQQNNNNNNNKNRMRNRNNRKPSNSVNRNYESNGPDVKIRGNAAHIAEKYATLARDALSSGDRVIAENYLQHAEHYNRIVLAANALRDEAQTAQNRGNQPEMDDDSDDADDQDNRSENAENNSNDRPRRRDSRGESRNNPRDNNPRDNNPRDNTSRDNVDLSMNGRSKSRIDSDDGFDSNDRDQPDVQERASGAIAAEGSESKPRARRTSRKKPEPVESISPDAAALPQGLLGASAKVENLSSED